MKISRALFLPSILLALIIVSRASAQTIQSLTNQLANIAGEQVTISDLGKNKLTIVSFWATWCKPCKEEMKAMQPLYDRLKDRGVQYIAVSIDDTKTMAKVAPYIASKKYTFNVLFDPNKDVFKTLNGTDVPFTVIFRADGSLLKKSDGYLEGDALTLEKDLTDLLNQAATPSDTAK